MTKVKKQSGPQTALSRQCETRTRLIQTMLNLVVSSSYNAVSVEDICKAAGARKGSFYHFFPSKAELLYEVFTQEWESCRAEMDEVFSACRPPLERFRKLGEITIAEQIEKRDELGYICGCPFITVGSELATQDERLRAKIEMIFAGHARYVESTLRDAIAEGSIPAVTDIEAKAREITNFLIGALLTARIRNSIEPLEQAFSTGLYHLLGITPPKPSRRTAKKAA